MDKADNDEMQERLTIVKDFLVRYRRKQYSEIFDEDFENQFRKWEIVQETGLTKKELYYCLCGKPNLLKLEEPVKIGSINNYINRIQYKVDKKTGFIIKSVSEENRILYDHIKYSFKQNPCVNRYVTTSVMESYNLLYNPKEEERLKAKAVKEHKRYLIPIPSYEFCIVFQFTYSEGISSMIEDIAT